MTRVDVIVPCYQYGQYLETCVRSILDQEGVDVRVLIIDDCSTDSSAAVAATLASADTRIESRRHGTNLGHIRTYNEGIDWASAPYLLLISADDALTRGSLARSLAVLDREPGITMAFGRALPVFDNSELPHCAAPADFGYSILAGPQFIDEMSDLPRNPVSTPTVIVRTALQKEIGGYDTRLPHAGDLEMWLRFADRGSLGRIDVAQAFRRVHPHNMQKQYLAAALGDHLQLQATFEIFADRTVAPGNRQAFLGRAFHGVAMDALWQADQAFEAGEMDRCEALAHFAVSLSPRIAAERSWSRLVWKRRIGPRAFRLLDTLRSTVRARPAAPVQIDAPPANLRVSA